MPPEPSVSSRTYRPTLRPDETVAPPSTVPTYLAAGRQSATKAQYPGGVHDSWRSVVRLKCVLGARECSRTHFFSISAAAVDDSVPKLDVALCATGSMTARHPKQVNAHENLTVALRAGTDPDARHTDGPRCLLRYVRRDRFEHDRIDPGALQRSRIGNDFGGRVTATPLHIEASERVQPLRLQSKRAHDRDAGADDTSYVLAELRPPLELYTLEGTILYELSRTFDGLFRRHLVAHERHVAYEVRSRLRARDCTSVVATLFASHLQRVCQPLHHHPQRVAYEDGVYPRLVHEARHREVGCWHHHERRALSLSRAEGRYAYPLLMS